MKLAYVGGLGMMAGPAAKHLMAPSPAQVIRVHDRGTPGAARDGYRADWQQHGAVLVSSFEALVGDGDFDGVVICAGKNGDDLALIADLARRLAAFDDGQPRFLLHLSTVSPAFARAAQRYCAARQVDYANYPLTGGPLGAQLGGADANGMLILASGDEALYQRLLPVLECLGRPRFFGADPAAGAVTKLIGHHMVFNGLNGIATAAAIHSDQFNDGALGGADQGDFLTFLNGGAGGTRQWEVGLRKGIVDDCWDQGFSIHHAVIDALYAAQLAADAGLSRISTQAMTNTAFAFAYMLQRHPGATLGTHAVVREMVRGEAAALDRFMEAQGAFQADTRAAIAACLDALPPAIRESACMAIDVASFEAAV